MDFVAVDAVLSLLPLVNTGAAFDGYIKDGGGLLLGIVPTNTQVGSHYIGDLVDTSLAVLRQHAETGGIAHEAVLARTLLSPACGLAMRTVPDCEQISDDLRIAKKMLVAGSAVAAVR